jgi:hypothetical protein
MLRRVLVAHFKYYPCISLETGLQKYARPLSTGELMEMGGEYENISMKHVVYLWTSGFS